MKVLIWIGCIFCASLVQVLLSYVGIYGALPAIAIYGGMFASARFFCKKYEEHQNQGTNAGIVGREVEMPTQAVVQKKETPIQQTDIPPILYCRKCGKRLMADSTFCSYCGTAIRME